jgi:hypothetical protein
MNRPLMTFFLSFGLLFSGPSVAKKKDKKEKKEKVEKDEKDEKAVKMEAPKRPKYTPFSENAVGFRGVGEVWQESAIVMVHRSSRFGGAGFFHTGLTHLFGFEMELGYNRMKGSAVDPTTNEQTGNASTLELVPIAMNATVRAEGPASEMFFGAGPAFVAFNDRSPTNAISGVKVGLDMRVGMRIHTHFLQESIRPGARGMRRMDFELMLGRRQHQAFGIGSGLDLSAWRVGAGLVGRL